MNKKKLQIFFTYSASTAGFSTVEILFAAVIFLIAATAASALLGHSLEAHQKSLARTQATYFASEGIEAVRSIKNQNYSLLASSSATGVSLTSGVWGFSGTHNTAHNLTRTIQVQNVFRDTNGDISSTGIFDSDTKRVISTVQWQDQNNRKPSQVQFSTYLTNWRAKGALKGGLLVYGNGGTTSDSIQYKTYDGAANTWSVAANAADVDTATTNKAVRNAIVTASPTRNEKILVTRHYNGTSQYIYAQVFNGTTWGNVQLLSSWNSSTYLDVQNFDGTYLNNGNYMVVYSDNTTTPKFRTWDGSSWSEQVAMNTLDAVPTYVLAKNRPNSNEVMASFFDSANDTSSQYFNGGAYQTNSWSAVTIHATNASSNTARMIDFSWGISNPNTGVLIHSNASNDKSMNARVWLANGSGGGSWGTSANSSNQASNLGVVSISSSPTGNEFLGCNKDQEALPRIICNKITVTGTTASWNDTTNNILVSGTDTGVQRSYHQAFERSTGDTALSVYSDNTAIPKWKLYTTSSSSWSSSPGSINSLSSVLSSVTSVRMRSDLQNDNIFVFLTDSNQNLYSVLWNGSTNTFYTTPVGAGFTRHGTAGSASTDLWYDYAWNAN